jgi:hypothetical protein
LLFKSEFGLKWRQISMDFIVSLAHFGDQGMADVFRIDKAFVILN